MLPAWATVAISLGGAGIVAVFSLIGTILVARRQDASEWRASLVTEGNEFSTGVGQALRAVRDALDAFTDAVTPRDPEEASRAVERTVAEASRLVSVAEDRLPRVLLLYGQDKEVGNAAEAAIEALREADTELRGYLDGWLDDGHSGIGPKLPAAKTAYEKARGHHRAFNLFARDAIPGRP